MSIIPHSSVRIWARIFSLKLDCSHRDFELQLIRTDALTQFQLDYKELPSSNDRLAKYQIDTPRWHAIRKLDSAAQPPWNDADSDSDDDIADKEDNDAGGDEPDIGTELAETNDEIARVYLECLSSDGFVFRQPLGARSCPSAGR